MQKHVSRREMLRRMEQGRLAMRVLAAATVEAGGVIVIGRDTFESLPSDHRMSCVRDEHTGDLTVRVMMPAPEPATTFEDLRRKYGHQEPAPEEVPEVEPTRGADGPARE